MKLSTLIPYLQLLATALIPAAAAWIVRRIKNPTDAERAQLIGRIAEDAAMLLISKFPTWDAARLIAELIRQLRSQINVPTANEGVLERVATAAVTRAIAASRAVK